MSIDVSKVLPLSSAAYKGEKGSDAAQRVDARAFGRTLQTEPETDETKEDSMKKEPVSKAKLVKAVDEVNEQPEVVAKRLHFKIHDGTGDLFVEITNADTGKVLGQIPPKELLDLQARLQTQESPEGLLVDSTV